jgi:SH3 domain-containing YSC84-like protein 1
MLRHVSRTRLGFVVVLFGVLQVAAAAQGRTEEETIRAAGEVLQQFLDLQIKEIPEALLAEAHGVAIIPNVLKVGLVLGGQRGRGVVVIRERDGSWRAPLFVTLTGGSIGWQVGAQSTDFVLVFKSPKSVAGLMKGKFTLGADAAVAAGPVGRRAGAATDVELQAEIYSYSRSRGLFAGVSLDGSALQVEDASNAAYYGGGGGTPQMIPEPALKLVELIAHRTANAAAGPGVAAAPAASPGPLPSLPPPPGPALPNLAPRPGHSTDDLAAELVQAATALSPLLDEAWRRHLALPAEFFQPGRHPAPEQVQHTLQRYNAVARDPQYRALTSRTEFQTTHRLLQAYAAVPAL